MLAAALSLVLLGGASQGEGPVSLVVARLVEARPVGGESCADGEICLSAPYDVTFDQVRTISGERLRSTVKLQIRRDGAWLQNETLVMVVERTDSGLQVLETYGSDERGRACIVEDDFKRYGLAIPASLPRDTDGLYPAICIPIGAPADTI